MRTLDSDRDAGDLLVDRVRPSDSSGVLGGCLDVQNELSVPWVVAVDVLRDCLVRLCSRSDAMVSPPAVARGGVAVMSVLFLTLVGKVGGVVTIVDDDSRMKERDGVLPIENILVRCRRGG